MLVTRFADKGLPSGQTELKSQKKKKTGISLSMSYIKIMCFSSEITFLVLLNNTDQVPRSGSNGVFVVHI